MAINNQFLIGLLNSLFTKERNDIFYWSHIRFSVRPVFIYVDTKLVVVEVQKKVGLEAHTHTHKLHAFEKEGEKPQKWWPFFFVPIE